MKDIVYMVIEFMIFAVGAVTIMAGLLWVFWWSVGKIIKMLGYWKYFIKALGIAAREINEKKRKNDRS